MPQKKLIQSLEDQSKEIKFGHNKILNDLEKRLTDSGFLVFKNQPFCVQLNDNLTLYGEMDLQGIDYKKRTIVATEVKSIWQEELIKKAYTQLIKDLFYLKEHYPHFDIVLMYAYRSDDKKGYTCQRIRKNEIKKTIKKIKNKDN